MKKTIIIFLTALLFQGCNPPPEYAEINGLTQGTTYHIVFETAPQRDLSDIRTQIERILTGVDNSLSIYNDSSVISLINSNINYHTDTLFCEMFRQSKDVWEKSAGAFDITVGPLVKAWGFGPDAMKRFDETKLDSLMALVGMEKVSLSGGSLVKYDPDMYIDVNAIAQGYTVDLLIDFLNNRGINDCLVEVGGEVRTSGDKGGKGWRVGVDKPVDGNNNPGEDLEAIVRLDGLSLATSGNYRKFYIDNGVKYSHTIDPHTGYPVRHTLLSATIISSACATADAWATVCMVVGKDSAAAFIEKYDFLEGYLIYSDEEGNMKTWMSAGLKKIVEEE
ncbi:MAG TPA: FAD:protein FMN transferase [Bacteroidales bacterium]|nr:FAD:protein FMN transferase [Bacteroidales bacterium]